MYQSPIEVPTVLSQQENLFVTSTFVPLLAFLDPSLCSVTS
jgi:hypothetical protein